MDRRAKHERFRLTLPAETAALVEARRAVENVDALNDFPEAQFALRVLVSELFANGIKYGGGWPNHTRAGGSRRLRPRRDR